MFPHVDVGKFDCRYLTRVRGFFVARLLGASSSAFLLSWAMGAGATSGVLNPSGLTIAESNSEEGDVLAGNKRDLTKMG